MLFRSGGGWRKRSGDVVEVGSDGVGIVGKKGVDAMWQIEVYLKIASWTRRCHCRDVGGGRSSACEGDIAVGSMM